MAEFPAMPLWTDAYLADTRHLTTVQHGAYLLLLMTAWRSPDGGLPDDERLLARYSGLPLDKWRKIAPVILEFFSLRRGGKIYQARVLDELQLLQSKRASQAAAGRASALKRKGRHSTDVEPEGNERTNGASTPTTTPTQLEPDGSNVGRSTKRRPSKKPITPDWQPSPFGKDTKALTIISGWEPGRHEREVEAFKAHHGSRANCFSDWQQAWATWVLNSEHFDKGRQNGAGQQQGNRTTQAAVGAFGHPSSWSDTDPF